MTRKEEGGRWKSRRRMQGYRRKKDVTGPMILPVLREREREREEEEEGKSPRPFFSDAALFVRSSKRVSSLPPPPSFLPASLVYSPSVSLSSKLVSKGREEEEEEEEETLSQDDDPRDNRVPAHSATLFGGRFERDCITFLPVALRIEDREYRANITYRRKQIPSFSYTRTRNVNLSSVYDF